MSKKFSVNRQKRLMEEKEAQRRDDFKKTCRFVVTFVVILTAIIIGTFVSVAEDMREEGTVAYLSQKYQRSFVIESKLSNKDEKKELGEKVDYAYYIVSDDESFVAGVKNNTYFDTRVNE